MAQTGSIKDFPLGFLWTRDPVADQQDAVQKFVALRDMPVLGTEYLLDDDETYLEQVPFRRRN